ncbi:MAG: LemA family protein [Candidatus Micrarchaeota archaeon]|nr:LemA family protein [Candidatus Micrarchaeota archaeon]
MDLFSNLMKNSYNLLIYSIFILLIIAALLKEYSFISVPSEFLGKLLASALFAFAGLYVYRIGFKLYKLLKKIEYSPTSKIVGLSAGDVEVFGKAKKYQHSYISTFLGEECLFYHTAFYESNRKNKQKKLIKTDSTTTPFLVEDETGQVLVDVEAFAKADGLYLKKDSVERTRQDFFGFLIELFRAFTDKKYAEKLKKEMQDQEALLNKIKQMQEEKQQFYESFKKRVEERCPELLRIHSLNSLIVEETIIKEGDQLFLFGFAQPVESKDAEIIITKKDHFFVSEEKEQISKGYVFYKSVVYLLIGIVVFLFSSYQLLSLFISEQNISILILTIFAIILLLAIFVVYLLEFHNSIVRLRQQIEKAKANIDTFYKKRIDLLPSLIELVKYYSKNEQEIQQTISALSSSLYSKDSKELLAILENYPSLAANQNFVLLQKQIQKIEEQLAAGREFLNDSIALYNARINSFPYFIIAKLINYKEYAHETY